MYRKLVYKSLARPRLHLSMRSVPFLNLSAYCAVRRRASGLLSSLHRVYSGLFEPLTLLAVLLFYDQLIICRLVA